MKGSAGQLLSGSSGSVPTISYSARVLAQVEIMKLARNLIQGGSGGLVGGALLGLAEAAYLLASSGAPDLLSPFYAVVLYGLVGLPFGIGAGVATTLLEKGYRPVSDGVAWCFGAAGAITPIGLFVLRYLANKVVFAEQGVPMTGNLAILVVIGIVDVALLFVVARLIDGKMPSLLKAKGMGMAYGGLLLVTGLVALLPIGDDPRGDWAHGKHASGDLADAPNVMVIMVDTLRADHLGTYGYPGNPTPNIDAFASDGIVFEENFAAASWTRSSGASIMSSRIPSGHNAPRKADKLPDGVMTYAEVLQAGGYATGALINNINLTSTFNFQQGYDTFIYESPEYAFMASESVFGLTMYKVVHKLNERLFGGHKRVVDFYQPADRVLGDAQGFIEANKNGRWSLFVHLMEPHDPYFEHPHIMGTSEAKFNGVGYARAEHEHPDSSPENVEYLKRVYADEVKYLDELMAPFFDWLKTSGNYDNTVIILTADHGEEFYEHGGFWHGTTLYDEQIHVPLIVKLAKGEHAGTRIGWQSRNIDIAPTIAASAGIDPDASWEGTDLIVDVERMIKEAAEAKAEEAAAAAAAALAEAAELAEQVDGEGEEAIAEAATVEAPKVDDKCAAYRKWEGFGRPAVSEEDFEGNVISAIRKDGFKLIRSNAGNPRGLPERELFDVLADGGETKNHSGSEDAICGNYLDSVEEQHEEEMDLVIKNAAAGASAGGQTCVSDSEFQKLVQLGYMEADDRSNVCQD
jgi:arylsulfatase A-like enzyme